MKCVIRNHTLAQLLVCLSFGFVFISCEQTRELATEMYQRLGGRVPAAPGPAPSARKQLRFELLDQLARCEVRHRGLFIDISSGQSDSHRPFTPGPFEDVRRVQAAGVSSSEMLLPRITYDFFLDKPAQNVALTVKGAQGSASHVTAHVDGRRVGAVKLGETKAAVGELGTIGGDLEPGRHTVELRMSGRGAQPGEVKANLQWLRIHFASDRDLHYPAPSWENLVIDAALSDVPRRAVALRAPGSVRCGLVPVRGTRVRIDVGYWGEGSGMATVRVRSADGEVVALAEQRVDGGEQARWLPLDLTLDAFAEQLVVLELSATEGEVGGRVLFGEPRLERTVPPRPPTRTNVAVLAVMGGLDRRLIPPWGSREGMPALFELAQAGVVFEGYRASVTNVNGVMASLLTGMRPAAHGVAFASARLRSDVPLLSEAVRKRDGRAAFFTNVPYTFDAFGFDRGWDQFESYSPVEDRPGSAPILHGRDWLKEHLVNDSGGPRLLVMHLSAAHPPWDVTPEEARMLPPEDYNGIVEPRRGAVALREVRQRNRASRRILGPNDWQRVEALQVATLQKLDSALEALIGELKRSGVWDDALVVVMGDVGMGDRSGVPFDPMGRLEEARLSVPLVVKFPGPRPPQARVQELVNTRAVSSTIATALGVQSELHGDGRPLERLLEPTSVLTRSPSVARKGEDYVLYLGRYRLAGELGAMPQLCDLEVDPTCRFDLADEQPFVVQWMWRIGLPEFATAEPHQERPDVRLVEPDERTQNALSVYGL